MNSGDFQKLVAEGDYRRNRRDWRAAVEKYREAVALRPAAVDIQVQLGHALKESGDYSGAEQAYRAAWVARPNDAETALQLGHLFNRQGDIAAALEWYTIASCLSPENADIERHRGTAERLARHRPSVELVMRAEQAMRLRKFRVARDLLRSAIEEHGRDDIFAIYGHALKECGAFDAAAEAYARYHEHALRREPASLSDAALQRGHLEKVRGNIVGALRYYIEAKERKRETAGPLSTNDPVLLEIATCMQTLHPLLKPRA
jgi:tetratricopeptide (TPR) repeat protein